MPTLKRHVTAHLEHMVLLRIYDGDGIHRQEFGSRTELWKGGFGKLFRDSGRKITSPRRASVLRGWYVLFCRENRECGKRFLSEPDTNVTVFSGTRYARPVSRAREQQRYGDGKLVENFLNACLLYTS